MTLSFSVFTGEKTTNLLMHAQSKVLCSNRPHLHFTHHEEGGWMCSVLLSTPQFSRNATKHKSFLTLPVFDPTGEKTNKPADAHNKWDFLHSGHTFFPPSTGGMEGCFQHHWTPTQCWETQQNTCHFHCPQLTPCEKNDKPADVHGKWFFSSIRPHILSNHPLEGWMDACAAVVAQRCIWSKNPFTLGEQVCHYTQHCDGTTRANGNI